MPDTTKTYTADGIEVVYVIPRCIHAAACVRGLPDVFAPDRRPWVAPENADNDAVMEVVTRCPTGALRARRSDGGWEEDTPETNTIAVQPDGPLYVRGDIRIQTPEGETLLTDTRMALCRCGRSTHKPFCDNSHTDEGFQASATLPPDAEAVEAKAEGGTSLTITLQRDGPLILRGPVTLEGDDHAVTVQKQALCRCGESARKPFCDGSHRTAGFSAPASLEFRNDD